MSQDIILDLMARLPWWTPGWLQKAIYLAATARLGEVV